MRYIETWRPPRIEFASGDREDALCCRVRDTNDAETSKTYRALLTSRGYAGFIRVTFAVRASSDVFQDPGEQHTVTFCNFVREGREAGGRAEVKIRCHYRDGARGDGF